MSQTQKVKYPMIPLMRCLEFSIHRDRRVEVTRDWEGEVNGNPFSWETDGDKGCTALCMQLMPLTLYT